MNFLTALIDCLTYLFLWKKTKATSMATTRDIKVFIKIAIIPNCGSSFVIMSVINITAMTIANLIKLNAIYFFELILKPRLKII